MTIIKLNNEKSFSYDWILLFLGFFSLIALLVSFYQSENLSPCVLCNAQRLVYLIIFILSPIGLFKYLNFYVKRWLVIFLLLGFFISLYHLLIQYGLLFDRCVTTYKIETPEDFLKSLDNSKKGCSYIWKIFGIPISLYNALFFFSSALFLHRTKAKS